MRSIMSLYEYKGLHFSYLAISKIKKTKKQKNKYPQNNICLKKTPPPYDGKNE